MNGERERIRKEVFDKPKDKTQEQPDISSGNSIEINSNINPGLLKMFPKERLDRIKKKELRKYESSQEKKWSKWLESVSK